MSGFKFVLPMIAAGGLVAMTAMTSGCANTPDADSNATMQREQAHRDALARSEEARRKAEEEAEAARQEAERAREEARRANQMFNNGLSK